MNPTYDFTGQVALVTGGSSGMGLATARAFAEAGAAVVIADINETTLGTAADELTAAGHRVLGVRCDVSDEHSVAAMVKATVHTFGRLDMAYNNAGIQVPPSDAADEPAEVFDRVNAINLRGVWACMKHELGQMRAQGSGAIRQLLLPRRSGWTSGPGGLPCVQARGDRADHQRRPGVRAPRHPHQRCLPRRHRHPDGRRHGRQGRAQPGRRRRLDTDRPTRPC
jgi:NAD(P)-dependent dehydrogenase (short-subunit alcohol dehydrogenase family)